MLTDVTVSPASTNVVDVVVKLLTSVVVLTIVAELVMVVGRSCVCVVVETLVLNPICQQIAIHTGAEGLPIAGATSQQVGGRYGIPEQTL